VLLHGAVVTMETAQLALNPYQAFQMLSICNQMLMHPLKIIHNGPILIKLYQPVLGVQFFKHSAFMQ